MMKRKYKGQTLIEFAVLFIVLVAAFLAMQNYLRRGVQGKWKESLDGMGKQYDPTAVGHTTYTMETNATTEISVANDLGNQTGGYRTWRVDTTNSTENKDEYIKIMGL